tara:strand:- start:733 stop:1329 length:597 start_codon:yes stop_codon:yes gene_type:complete
MSITYPLTPPSSPQYVTQQWSIIRGVGISESPFTGVQQTVEFDLAKWKAVLSLPPMKRSQAHEWVSFLVKLHGRRGTFFLSDNDARAPQNSISGSVTVTNAASAGDIVLTLTGTTAFSAGDYVQIGTGSSSRLHMVVADQSGGSTIQIEPKLKSSVAQGTTITYTNPKGIFRMDSNELMWDTNAVSAYGISFSCSEVD